ncbi:MAG: hypothetical protein A2286_06225 [Gammaproteobacteria bacterium RIFOXYA12_FULL_61_12]|nr:MAG: hypothetical protein A2514_12775 [Gammaproteobacteria bacterium RIFOXYD12_FULL_61_37]OGT93732.1 MAG: hypothetical protein A2286_06225 [Gammaproteobacteria bacterium RIFOXYA12_FULL_61_12]
MQPSDEGRAVPGAAIAVVAEILYLANLLIAPGFAFALLLLLFLHRRRDVPPLARSHLEQTLSASLWAGLLLILVASLILVLGGMHGAHTWVILILYFTLCHSTLVVFGAYGLAKAMAGQCWRYPLVGRPLARGCREIRWQ